MTNGKPNTGRGRREAGDRLSERRLCETRVPMNKNLIEGRRDAASWNKTTNSTGEVVEVNQAVVRGRTASLPGEVSGVRAPEKSAEVIGDSQGGASCQPQPQGVLAHESK